MTAPAPDSRSGPPGGSTAPGPAPVTVIIATFNEEANLPAALDSVRGWAKEVYVIDSYSTDRTVEIALARAAEGVRVVQHPFRNLCQQWHWALDRLPLSTEWVMELDADERVTPEFREEFLRLTSDPANPNVAYYSRRVLVFMGRRLNSKANLLNWDNRIWKHRHGRFEDRRDNMHVLIQGGPAGRTQAMIEHHDHKDFTSWIEKQNYHSSLEALPLIHGEASGVAAPRFFGNKAERTRWLRNRFYRIPGRHLLHFFLLAVVRGAYRDGWIGIHYAVLKTFIYYMIDLKILEHRLTGREPKIPRPSFGQPHPQVVHSELQRFMDQRTEFNQLAPGVSFPWLERQRAEEAAAARAATPD